jgi:hypothetical protein
MSTMKSQKTPTVVALTEWLPFVAQKKTRNKKVTDNMTVGEFDLLWRIPTCGHSGTEWPSPRAFCTEVPAMRERPSGVKKKKINKKQVRNGEKEEGSGVKKSLTCAHEPKVLTSDIYYYCSTI